MPPAQVEAEVWPICRPYWVAYHVLTESRPWAVGMGGSMPLPIPYTELSQYARDHGLAESYADLDEFVFLVGQLDQAYLNHKAEST